MTVRPLYPLAGWHALAHAAHPPSRCGCSSCWCASSPSRLSTTRRWGSCSRAPAVCPVARVESGSWMIDMADTLRVRRAPPELGDLRKLAANNCGGRLVLPTGGRTGITRRRRCGRVRPRAPCPPGRSARRARRGSRPVPIGTRRRGHAHRPHRSTRSRCCGLRGNRCAGAGEHGSCPDLTLVIVIVIERGKTD